MGKNSAHSYDSACISHDFFLVINWFYVRNASTAGLPGNNWASSKVMEENVSSDKHLALAVPRATAMELDHSDCSNSEVSAADSVSGSDESRIGRKRMNAATFIDFLGVGADS